MKKFLAVSFFLLILILEEVSFASSMVLVQEVVGYPPLKYEDNNSITGFSPELIKAIFKDNNYDIKLTKGEWSDVYKNIKEGEIDTCGVVAIMEDRKKFILYSKPVMHFHVGIFTLKSFNKEININNLDNFKIGVLKDAYTHELISKRVKQENLITFTTSYDEVMALISQKVDAIVEAHEVVNFYSTKYNLSQLIKTQKQDLYTVPFAFAVKKDRHDLVDFINRRLGMLIESGIFEQIYVNHFGTHSHMYFEKQRDVYLKIAGIIVFLILAIVFALWLQNKILRKRLTAEQLFLKTIVENANAFVVVLDQEGKIIRFNNYAEEVTGYSEKEVLGKDWVDIFIDKPLKNYMKNTFNKMFEMRIMNNHENPIVCKDGKTIHVLWNNRVFKDPIAQKEYIISVGIDITSLKQAQKMLEDTNLELEEMNEALSSSKEEIEKQFEEIKKKDQMLEESEKKYRFIVENINDSVWEINFEENKVIYYGGAKEFDYGNIDLSQRSLDYWMGKIPKEDVSMVMSKIQERTSQKDDKFEFEFRLTPDGENCYWVLTKGKIFYNSEGKPVKVLGVTMDITEKKMYEEKIRLLAYYDELTGLPNRISFKEKLSKLISEAIKYGKKGAILQLDIDNFRHVNDFYGHAFGDLFLKLIASRLYNVIEKYGGFLARLSGDLFGIIVMSDDIENDITKLADEILHLFNKPWEIGKVEIYTTVSIGISMFPQDGDDVVKIMRNVDVVLYSVKDSGKNGYKFFTQDMIKHSIKRIDMERKLRNAIENNQFLLLYQPKYDLKSLNIVEAEALIRWNDKQRGIILPYEFIPLAEETGLIVNIDKWVINQAAQQIREWMDKGINLFVSINISARHFQQKDFAEYLFNIVKKYNIPSNMLEIEITETAAMKDIEHTKKVLNELGEKGFSISIDDFGTGYSSLNYLKELKIDHLKIDRSFISGIENGSKNKTIVEVIIYLAHSLSIKTVAEGIENQEQLKFLIEKGCDLAQGYYFSKPISPEELEKLIGIN